jgi:hypothetical protein
MAALAAVAARMKTHSSLDQCQLASSLVETFPADLDGTCHYSTAAVHKYVGRQRKSSLNRVWNHNSRQSLRSRGPNPMLPLITYPAKLGQPSIRDEVHTAEWLLRGLCCTKESIR